MWTKTLAALFTLTLLLAGCSNENGEQNHLDQSKKGEPTQPVPPPPPTVGPQGGLHQY